jgi:hypothetical protein
MRSSATTTRFGGGVPLSECQRAEHVSPFSLHEMNLSSGATITTE